MRRKRKKTLSSLIALVLACMLIVSAVPAMADEVSDIDGVPQIETLAQEDQITAASEVEAAESETEESSEEVQSESEVTEPEETDEISADEGTQEETTESSAEETAETKTETKKATASVKKAARAASGYTVSNTGYISYGSLGSHNDSNLTINGQIAYCLNPETHAPDSGTYSASFVSTTTSTQLVNVLYYGYGGAGDITGKYGLSTSERHVLTHAAAAKVYGGNWTYGLNSTGISLVNQFISDISALATISGSVLIFCQYEGGQNVGTLVSYSNPKGELKLSKTSTIPQISDSNTHYSLEGAVYGVYSDSACTAEVGSFTTRADGYSTGSLKLSPGTYYVKEKTAPKGFCLSQTVYTATVQGGTTSTVSVSDTPGNDPVSVLLTKRDAETGEAQAKTRLSGAQYTVKYYDVSSEEELASAEATRTWVFETNKSGFVFLSNEYLASGDSLYQGSTEAIYVLPLGFITIQETKAPDGYILDDTIYVCQTSESNGVITTSNLPTDETAISEQPIRGDLSFKKASAASGKAMSGIPFRITSQTTGESHVIVSDENGNVSTSSDNNLHTQHTNRGESSHDGIWFGDADKIDNSKGALLYDDYLVEELPCDANYGMDLVSFTVSITANNVTVALGKVDNLTIGIETTALSDTTGIQTAPVGENETITDTITYTNLTAGRTYRFEGEVVDAETEEVIASGKTEFVPSASNGTVDVSMTMDTTSLEGKTLVIYEKLYDNTGLRADHSDRFDEKQMIYVPNIGTKASDGLTKDQVGSIGEKTTLVDTISYKGLQPGKEYTMSGTLMDKKIGDKLLIDGKEVTAETTFTPESSEGTVDVTFTFDTTGLTGTSVVAFETVSYEGIELTVHADIEDEDQTVDYPEIHTSASDSQTKEKQGVAGETATIIDTVSYKNLTIGKEYTISGTLMNASTGEKLLVDGKEVTAETTFIAKTTDGSVQLTYTFASSAVAGTTVVVFEDLYHNDVKIASHADIEDKDQTVYIPKIHTTALAKDTESHIGSIGKNVTITDTVAYTNLIIGKGYTVSGTLMNKATGEKLLVNGKAVTAETTFTAEKTDGTVELVYELDSSALAGTTAVVFETLTYQGIEVASHADLTDEEQSVHYPKLHTEATINGNHNVTAGGTKTLIDTVTYENLIPGETYTISGTLMVKETGEKLLVNGKAVTAETTFTPEKAEGTVELSYTFDTTGLGGKTIVVFENLYHKGIEVTTHADLTDQAQSVVLEVPPKTEVPPTGDTTQTTVLLLALAIAVTGMTFCIVRKKKADHKR